MVPPIKCREDSTELAMSGTDATDSWLQRETNGRDLGNESRSAAGKEHKGKCRKNMIWTWWEE